MTMAAAGLSPTVDFVHEKEKKGKKTPNRLSVNVLLAPNPCRCGKDALTHKDKK